LQELISYTDREIENWDNSPNINIAKNIDDVISFVSRSINGEVNGQKIMLGKVGSDLAARIYNEIGINLEWYNLELRANEIRHSFNEHGNQQKEAMRGQQAITTEDMANFSRVVIEFETVSATKNNGLQFVKNINGQIIVVCVYAKGNKSISLKTMYKKQG